MSKGEWLVLASAHYFLDDVKDLCELQGWYFSHRGRNSIPLDLLMAIQHWQEWSKGGMLNVIQIKNIYSYLGENITRGYRTGKTMNNDLSYTREDCTADHGLLTDKVWYEAFTKIDTNTENYIRNMLANREKISQTPRITMSTIHGAKGGEADNVLLLPDITKSSVDQNDREPDELHRLFYVAVTRAKENLHILEPRNYERAYVL